MTDKTNNNDKSGTSLFEDDVIDWQDLSRPSFIPKRKSAVKKTSHRKTSDKVFYEYQQCFLSNKETLMEKNTDKTDSANIASKEAKRHTLEQKHYTNNAFDTSNEVDGTTSEFYVISDNLPTLDEYENIDTINASKLSHDEFNLNNDINQLVERHASDLNHDQKSSLQQAILNIIMASK